jgi:hypothetical protein
MLPFQDDTQNAYIAVVTAHRFPESLPEGLLRSGSWFSHRQPKMAKAKT